MTDASNVPSPPDEVVEAFAAALLDTRDATLTLARLLSIWDAVDVGWATTTGGRLRLADSLQRLQAQRLVELPSPRGSRWDPTLPRLPTRIAIPANRQSRIAALDPARELWVPALAWAAAWIRTSRPPQRYRVALLAVNRWLASTTGLIHPIISREERSLQIFDDEKALAALGGTTLFAPRRLSLDLLACEAPIGGVRLARLSDTGPVLVIENKATFDSVWRALRLQVDRGSSSAYAALVFGGGDQAETLVPELALLEQIIGVRATEFHYAGDIDVAGISAAAAFLGAATTIGLRASPALRFWERLSLAPPGGIDLTGDTDERNVAIKLAEQIALPPAVIKHLEDGVRVPQERIDRTAFADTSWWRP